MVHLSALAFDWPDPKHKSIIVMLSVIIIFFFAFAFMNTIFRKIVERVEHSDIGAVELILSNGMQVTYQCTKDDEEVMI